MATNEFKNECCLSNDIHGLKYPIVLLGCGHRACQTCVSKTEKKNFCKPCSKTGKRNKKEVNDPTQIIFDDKLNGLIELKTEVERNISILRDYVNEDKKPSYKRLEYIAEEIDNRIESIKAELDKMHEKLQNDLELVRKDLFNHTVENDKKIEDKIKNFEKLLMELNHDINNKVNQNQSKLDNYNAEFSILQDLSSRIQKRKFQLDYIPSTDLPMYSLIGDIRYKNSMTNIGNIQSLHHETLTFDEIKGYLNNNKFDVIKLDIMPVDICVLPTNQIVCAEPFKKNLIVYDECFKIVKEVDEINKKKFQPRGLAINHQNELYISDNFNHQILITDFKFNFIKAFGSFGNNSNQFKWPQGICLKNDCLYVCDGGNHRIQVFDINLAFLRTIQLDFLPTTINVFGKIALINSNNVTNVYDLIDCKVTRTNQLLGRLSEFNSYFYTFSTKSKTLIASDSDEFSTHKIVKCQFQNKINIFLCSGWSGLIFRLNGHLVINFDNHFIKFID